MYSTTIVTPAGDGRVVGSGTASALPPTRTPAMRARGLTLSYDGRRIVEGLDLDVPAGAVTVVVGPNGCGKSTVLRGLSRLLRPDEGQVHLATGDGLGDDVWSLRPKEFARRVALLPQNPPVPEGITVVDLVGRGRHPHHTLVRRWSADDDASVLRALRATGTVRLAERHVDELSGGQRQRVWIALALAQETGIVLLDEPTTYLDVAHQVDVLDRLHDLNRDHGTTVVMVLHDLNLAARYADHVVAMRDGRLVAQGAPGDIVDEQFVAEVFALESRVIADPVTGSPLVVPASTGHRAGRTGGSA